MCAAPAPMQNADALCTQCRSEDGKEQEGGMLHSHTSPWMVGQAENELSSIHSLNKKPSQIEIKESIATETQPNSYQIKTPWLQAISSHYFSKYQSRELMLDNEKINVEKKQKRLFPTLKMHSNASKARRERTFINAENCVSKHKVKYASLREPRRGNDCGEFRSVICSTSIRLLMMVMLLPWSEAASKTLIAQQPTVPTSRTYLHLTLQPPAQFHQSTDTTNFAQAPPHQSQATSFTVAPTSDTVSNGSEAIRDSIGRALDVQRSHFLVNDINVEHDNTATSVNEVFVGDTDEEQERQQNELQQRLRKEREEAAHKWAPVVWLHPKEIFFPGNVLDFLTNINISSSEGFDMQEYGSDAGLPQGPLSEELHLVAPIDTECCNCPVPGFLHGQRPLRGEGPPVYAHIHTCYSPIARTTSTPTINLLLRTPPDGEPVQARSLRAQIRSLQHPLPRYRRRRHRTRGRGRRDTAHGAHQQDSNSHGNFNKTNDEIITRQEKKMVQTEDQVREQHFKLPPEGNKETGQVAPQSTSVLASTVEIEQVNSNQRTTEPTPVTNPETSANFTSGQISDASGDDTFERNTRSPANEEFSTSRNTEADIPVKTELPRGTTSEPPTFTQKQTVPKLTETSQPIIIFGNYSRMSHMHATAIPTVFQAEQENSSVATTSSSSNPSQDTQYSGANRRHALSTTGTPGHHFTITYWFFYPYNHGKEVCTANMIFIGRVAKPLYKGECRGETVVMGNHVGDWEHLSIYFEDGEPRYLYISAHHFGAFYTYQPEWNRFKYSSQDVREGVFMSPQYPQYLELQQSRLVVYSAKGSHGTWPSQGRHMYNNVMVKLEDETGQGHLWDTRHKVHIIDALEEKRRGTTDTHRKWFDFRGKWGNPSSNCHPGMLGFCEMRDGPLGITMKRLNFPCHIPRHYTFPKP